MPLPPKAPSLPVVLRSGMTGVPAGGRVPPRAGPVELQPRRTEYRRCRMAMPLRNYINGQWVEADSTGFLPVENPSTGAIIGQVPLSTTAETNRAIAAAAAAFPAWSRTPGSRRVDSLFRLLNLLHEHDEAIARSISEENGKSLTDARAEVKRLIENTEVACGMPVLQQGDKLVGAADGIDGEVLRVPLGPFGMIAPFNFPGMVPFWFFPYALACGNTYVLKPSERTPLTLQRITQWIDRAGFPPGVFNLVNGDRVVAEALMDSPLVKGVSLVGSTRTCRIVAERCARNGKRFQAMGGAKNHLVVLPDARLDEVVRNLLSSCFGCAGQRCMAASAIVAVGPGLAERLCARLVEACRQIVVGNPLDPAIAEEPLLMGPVISAQSLAFIHEMIETGVRQGARLVLDGRGHPVPGGERGHFIGPTVLAGVQRGSTLHQTEIFGPVVILLEAASFDDAVRLLNDHPYGNGASIYTQNGYWARRFKLEVECGMIGINVGIPAPVAHLPFGGMKASQFSQIKAQGAAVIDFFTERKTVTERYWPETDASANPCA